MRVKMSRNEFKKRFQSWLVARRAVCNLTQTELADKCGLAQCWVSHFECGRRLPDAYALVKLCGVLGNFNPKA
jgi:transcriptional regulator with XRE-family HTH domain